MSTVIQVIGAFLAVVTIAVLNGVPIKYLIYSGTVGAAGWAVYLFMRFLELPEAIAMFVATLIVAIVSHVYARILKAPVTLFLVCGILPLVPGVAMYRVVYYLLISDNVTAGHYAITTVSVTGAIALAVFFVDTVFKLKKPKFWTTEFRSSKARRMFGEAKIIEISTKQSEK